MRQVFLCSGQSNMVLSVAAASSGGINASNPSIQQRTWPTLRLFSVTSTLKVAPWAVNTSTEQRDLPAYNSSVAECTWGHVWNQDNHMNPDKHLCQTWQTAVPGVTDSFSAECVYTAVSLIERGAIPAGRTVGLVLSAYSGTSMETWTPPDAFIGCPNKTKVLSLALSLSRFLALSLTLFLSLSLSLRWKALLRASATTSTLAQTLRRGCSRTRRAACGTR